MSTDGTGGTAAGRIGFHLLTVAAVLVCLVAARWQWERAHRTAEEAVPDVAAVALADLDPAQAYAGMRITVTGTYRPDHQVLVGPREWQGQVGAWVVTLLHPTGMPAGEDVAVAVVRGWIPAGAAPPAPPLGSETITGVLVADSRVPGVQVAGDPPTLEAVDTGALAGYAGRPVRSGWLALVGTGTGASGQPASAGASVPLDEPVPLDVTDLPGAEVGLNWRNAAYAIQWVVFAGFVVFFWLRFRREPDAAPQQQEISR